MIVVIMFELAHTDYREIESGDIEITIAKNVHVTLANPVTVRITPLTVPEALAREIITTFDDDDILSPNRAGKNYLLNLECILQYMYSLTMQLACGILYYYNQFTC